MICKNAHLCNIGNIKQIIYVNDSMMYFIHNTVWLIQRGIPTDICIIPRQLTAQALFLQEVIECRLGRCLRDSRSRSLKLYPHIWTKRYAVNLIAENSYTRRGLLPHNFASHRPYLPLCHLNRSMIISLTTFMSYRTNPENANMQSLKSPSNLTLYSS